MRAGYGERRFQVSTVKTMLDTASGSANRILVDYCALNPQSVVAEEYRRCGGWSWSSAKHRSTPTRRTTRYIGFSLVFFFAGDIKIGI